MRSMLPEIQYCAMNSIKTDLYVLETDSTDPYHNLALEEYLLDVLAADGVLLFLWQNYRTVVIGRNQSANQEVNIRQLEEDGGYLARRLSGGGAVFHDLGNLNFTFIIGKENFDLDRQTSVVLKALNDLGIEAVRNGRNDLTVNGCKFSGHAYYHAKANSFHHGTIMLDVDADSLEKYLNVSQKKLASKNVQSVRSRIINLKQLKPDLTIEELKLALKKSFEEVYGSKAVMLRDEFDLMEIEERLASAAWKYDREGSFEFSREGRFDWGTVTVKYDLQEDVIKDICIYTDCLETETLARLPQMLRNRKLDRQLLSLLKHPYQQDVVGLLLGGKSDEI